VIAPTAAGVVGVAGDITGAAKAAFCSVGLEVSSTGGATGTGVWTGGLGAIGGTSGAGSTRGVAWIGGAATVVDSTRGWAGGTIGVAGLAGAGGAPGAAGFI
jgi:pilus assembly protein FimV